MESAYIKALRKKYADSLSKAKSREKEKLNSLYKGFSLAIIEVAEQEIKLKEMLLNNESISKFFLPLLEVYLPQEPLPDISLPQDSQDNTPKIKE